MTDEKPAETPATETNAGTATTNAGATETVVPETSEAKAEAPAG